MNLMNHEDIHLKIKKSLELENLHLNSFLNLTANENIQSNMAINAFSSDLANRYHLGVSEDHTSSLIQDGDFIFKGLQHIFELEKLAIDLFNKKVNASYSDFRLLSGVHANICSLASMTEVGDNVLSIHPEDGGHFATSSMAIRMGRNSHFVRFSPEKFSISLEDLEKQVKNHKPKAFLIDHSATLFKFPIAEIRKIVGDECVLIYDASHTLGLIFGGSFQDPLREGCNVLQGNTHKTFPGPQKAIISFASESFGKKSSNVVSSGFISSQHTHHSVALYITVIEMHLYGKHYAKQIISNAKIFSKTLEENGFEVLSYNGDHTDSHMFFVRIPPKLTPLEACKILYNSKISVNATKVYGENLLRFGVQEITRMGLGKIEIERLAQILRYVLLDGRSPEKYGKEISEIKKNFNTVYYSFDCNNGGNS